MIPMPPTTLPRCDRRLLNIAEKLVPASERGDWSRSWHAELWHMRHFSRTRGLRSLTPLADLSVGLICDALWLRTNSWGQIWSGTATLCLASLLGLCVVAATIALLLAGSWHSASPQLIGEFYRSLIAAPLVLFVGFATASRRAFGPASSFRSFWIKRQVFSTAKVVELLALAFLLSSDLCQPIHASLPNTADIFQLFSFVVFTLVSLRWAFRDQEQRCKQCLRALATPARVGRPSRNLLEWNGTELNCRHGHGLLSIPEMETSWCQSSHWISLPTT